MRVLSLDPDGGMVFAWRYVTDPDPLRPLLYPANADLREPRARLVVRGGAGGGNPQAVFLDGSKNAYVSAVVPRAPEARVKPDVGEPHVGYVEGGLVPFGKVFLVEQIEYLARADGDGSGPGGFVLVVGGYVV